MAEAVSLIIGVLGVAGIIFTALRWRRDDTTAVLTQQQAVFSEMQGITDAMRADRDDTRIQLERCLESKP